MFGFGKKKEYDVRLTEKQLQEITSKMSKSERKEFERKQREVEKDREWDAMLMAELFYDD